MLLGILSYWLIESLFAVFYPVTASRLIRLALYLTLERGLLLAALLLPLGIALLSFSFKYASPQAAFVATLVAAPMLSYGCLGLLSNTKPIRLVMFQVIERSEKFDQVRGNGLTSFVIGLVCLALVLVFR